MKKCPTCNKTYPDFADTCPTCKIDLDTGEELKHSKNGKIGYIIEKIAERR